VAIDHGTNNRFVSLQLSDWRQFEEIDLRFHPHLTVLTGANGTGKTTILNVLSRHFGWTLPFVSSPEVRRSAVARRIARRRKTLEDPARAGDNRMIGSISYSDGITTGIHSPIDERETYEITFGAAVEVLGVYITSHRPIYSYQAVDTIPTKVDALQDVLTRYIRESRNRYSSAKTTPASVRIKEALISWAALGSGGEFLDANDAAIDAFRGFNRVLAAVLPSSLEFVRLRVASPNVILQTRTDDISFDAISGGIAAIVDLSWQVYLYSLIVPSFAVLIDEPENHLHPELQRRLMPQFVDAFPSVQFIIATHNPLIVGSVEDSTVYALKYASRRRVTSSALDMKTKAASANDILRTVLDVASTVPIWADREIESLLQRVSSEHLNQADADQLQSELTRLGMPQLMPDALRAWMVRRQSKVHDQD
jgi:hypothetical protein